jgi:malonyl-ACP decarboxylase
MLRPDGERVGVAITGMGVVCAIGDDVASFTAALRAGRSAVRPVRGGPGGDWLGAVLPDFSFPGAVAARRALPEPLRRVALCAGRRGDRPVKAALAAALQAWEDARLHDTAPPAERIALVVAGSNLTAAYAYAQYARHAANPAHVPASYALHALDTDHVGTISEALGVRGEGYTVGGASASGNVGIVNGARLVACGAADACLVVGAMTELSPLERRSLAALGALAGSAARDPAAARCRPFDAGHEGFAPGEGAACLVLESAGSARRRAAPALAWLAGHHLALDANRLPDAREDGEAGAMVAAMASAGVGPADIGYVNAHATGTPGGDRAELRALRRALGGSVDRPWVNATKALTGHCLSAAGVVEAVATVAQLRHRFIHPNPALRRPVEAGFRFAGAAAEPADVEHALSNSFGFGGFTTSIVLRRGDG